jgi:hypothetical protein
VASLLKDARFKAVAEDPVVKKAVEEHDVMTLLRTDSVLRLLKDSEAREKLMAAFSALQTSTPAPGLPPRPQPPTK